MGRYSTISVLNRKGEEVDFKQKCYDLKEYIKNLYPEDAVVIESVRKKKRNYPDRRGTLSPGGKRKKKRNLGEKSGIFSQTGQRKKNRWWPKETKRLKFPL